MVPKIKPWAPIFSQPASPTSPEHPSADFASNDPAKSPRSHFDRFFLDFFFDLGWILDGFCMDFAWNLDGYLMECSSFLFMMLWFVNAINWLKKWLIDWRIDLLGSLGRTRRGEHQRTRKRHRRFVMFMFFQWPLPKNYCLTTAILFFLGSAAWGGAFKFGWAIEHHSQPIR